MAKVTGQIIIQRPPDVVFDVVADERNEPKYNVDLLHVEKLTGGPVGVGTQFTAQHRTGRRQMEMTLEVTEYDPPRRIGSVTTASWATITGAVSFEPAEEGTRMRWPGRAAEGHGQAPDSTRPCCRPPPGADVLDRPQAVSGTRLITPEGTRADRRAETQRPGERIAALMVERGDCPRRSGYVSWFVELDQST
jgi:Polyketide cyclase / dehydrase and lipid transport